MAVDRRRHTCTRHRAVVWKTITTQADEVEGAIVEYYIIQFEHKSFATVGELLVALKE